uniref:cadherin-22-like isoform X3 n=1 Tax=Oncorhynchus gorbuscha TaxID=8017 RepID=UPI001EAF3662|nr:cadherin-22-like isoform X3 [Oncorhynchus gorbuscha]
MATCWRLGACSLLVALWLLHCCSCGWSETTRTNGVAKVETKEQELMSHERVKRGWVWNQFFVVEEYTGTEPLYVGKIQDVLDSVKPTLCEMCMPPNSGPPTENIHTDSDEGEGNIKYTISGEGAGTIFIIDELTGDIHATERLDREEQSYYTLRAQARDRLTNHLLESESEFVIKVQDINDSEPKFLEGPYIGSVGELSQIGTSVMKVTASDADDPTYGSSARVVYSVLDGERFFTVDRQTGLIRTAVADLDREKQDRYELVVKATDMAGQMGGLSGSTTVTIVITDVNDNPPRFPQKMYQFSMSEGAAVGTPVGRVIATDADMGENTDMSYLIKDEEGGELFKVTTDSDTQEAIITIKKALDFESKRTHNVVVEAVNKHVDPRFSELGSFRDQTIVRVSVNDIDEPPVFHPAEGTILEVQEDARLGALVGTVTAKDPDMENAPVRYSIDQSTDQEQIFHIDPVSGAITLGNILDRETAGWHNITVMAVEADNVSQISHSSVSIRILDVNDNPPELATPYEASICEDAKPGQLIHSISVVDRDEPQLGHRYYFTLAPEATNNRHFTLWDVKVLVLLILTLKRHRKGQSMSEDEEDMRDNVIKYNDEGGGEQDTQAYDMSTLRNLFDFPETKGSSSESGPELRTLPQWIQGRMSGDGEAADFSLFKGYIRKKVEQTDGDLSVPPYDSFQTYAFEGNSSPALSLSSIHTLSTTSDQDFSYLSDWGPRFRQLAGYYTPGHPEEDGS